MTLVAHLCRRSLRRARPFAEPPISMVSATPAARSTLFDTVSNVAPVPLSSNIATAWR